MSEIDNSINEEENSEGKRFKRHEFVADQGQEALRIDKFLVNRILNATRTRVQAAIEKEQLSVNGRTVKANYKVRPGDSIVLIVEDTREETVLHAENIPIDIVYEDEDIMVINKPAGLVVHPGVGNYSGTLLNALAYHFKVELDFEGKRPWLVHRIDKNTSGLLVVAKHDDALNFLSAQFKAHSIERTYHALVWGSLEENEGTIETFIGRDQYDRKRFTTYDDPEKGKRAVTHYKVLEDFMYVSYIECKLETGRTHQIRVHMKHIGHTLFNDERYGGSKILKGVVFSKYKQFIENCFQALPRHALHAKSLGFIHPRSKEWIQFDSELPEDFKLVLNKWRTVHTNNRFS